MATLNFLGTAAPTQPKKLTFLADTASTQQPAAQPQSLLYTNNMISAPVDFGAINVQKPFLERAAQAVGDYISGSVKQVTDLFTNPQAPSVNPLQLQFVTFPQKIGEAAAPAFQQGVEAVSGMFNDFMKGTGSTAGDVANLLKLTNATAGVLFSPVTGAFSTLAEAPVLKQVADMVNVPFTAAGFAGSFATGKILDFIPTSLVSQEAKDTVRTELESLGSLAAQVLVGGKIMSKMGDLVGKGQVVTPDIAKQLADSSKLEIADTSKAPVTSFFNQTPGSEVVKIDSLIPREPAAPASVTEAIARMRNVLDSKQAPRDPILVDSTGKVIDGNSTLQALKDLGYQDALIKRDTQPLSAADTSGGSSAKGIVTEPIKSSTVIDSRAILRKAEEDLSKISTDNLGPVASSLNISPSSLKNLTSKDVSDIRTLYDNLAKKASDFQDIINTVNESGGVGSFFEFKSAKSIFDKIGRKRYFKEYGAGNVQDFVRGETNVAAPNDAAPIIKALADKTIEVIDNFKNPNIWGYRGINMNVRLSDGTIGEMQIHTDVSKAIKDAIHPIYEQFRDLPPEDVPSHVYKTSQAIADKIYREGISKKAFDLTNKNGGVTIDVHGNVPKDGYAYAPSKATERIVKKEDFSQQHIDSYWQEHATELAKPENHIGLWEDNGQIYMDITRVGEASKFTIAQAQKAEQLGVYDLKNGRTIPTGQIVDGVYSKLNETTSGVDKHGGQDTGASSKPDVGSIREVPKSTSGVDKNSDTFRSRVFERLQAEHPDALKGELNYDPIKLKEEAAKAVELIEKDKQEAFRVAMGIETSKNVTSTAVNIALSEKALADGNTALYSRLVKNRSLEQTRRGQEIVSERGSVSDNSTSKYVKELIASRLEKLGNTSDINTSMSAKQKGIEVIDKEVRKARAKIKHKELDLEAAQKLIDSLACA